jgi:hypothetical protein
LHGAKFLLIIKSCLNGSVKYFPFAPNSALSENGEMKKLMLLLTLLSSNIMADTKPKLTLYFIPSPLGMDWSTPANLAMSALKNRLSFQSRFMGHVFVEVQCGGEKQLTGMVGKRFDYLNQLLIESRGLAVLYHSFAGGLEEKVNVEEEIKELSEDGERINFVSFHLNQGQCDRVSQYLKEYREKDVGRYYGLANRPLYAEGAGCSAFGASFLEVAGVMDLDIKDAWSQTVSIPLKFAGPPLTTEKVNLLKLMTSGSSWATPKEPHKNLMFWSPDRMFSWVKEKVSIAKDDKNFQVVELGKARGILYDKSHLPSPSGPIWQQHLDPSIQAFKK